MLNRRKKKKKATVLIKRGTTANSTGLSKHYQFVRCMKFTCKSLLAGASHVRIDQSLLTPIDADFVKRGLLCVLHRDLTPFALHSAALFSSSNQLKV